MTTLTLSTEPAESTTLSELRDPFRAECVDRIAMWIRKNWSGEVVYEAKVSFRNGATSGEQDIVAPDFESLVKKVGTFVNGLKTKQ